MRSKEIASIKVQWKNRPVEEFTWEHEADMQERNPHLSTDSGTLSRPCLPFQTFEDERWEICIYCNDSFGCFEY